MPIDQEIIKEILMKNVVATVPAVMVGDEPLTTKSISVCVVCGTPFEKRSRRHKYCSQKCLGIIAQETYKKRVAIGKLNGTLFGKPIQEAIYTRYRNGARARELPFDITLSEFKELWGKPCTYCGVSIYTIGIDRVQSDLGYTVSNITPCCTRCNLTKRNMLPEEYLALCARVVAHNRIKLFK